MRHLWGMLVVAGAASATACASQQLRPVQTEYVGYRHAPGEMREARYEAEPRKDQTGHYPRNVRGTAWPGGRSDWAAGGVSRVDRYNRGGAWRQAVAAPMMDEIADAEDLTSFEEALRLTGMDEELDTKGPYTVFAPIDFAFDELSYELKSDLYGAEGREQLRDLIKRHIVAGEYYGRDFNAETELTSLAGTPIPLKNWLGSKVTGEALVLEGTSTRNGVLFHVDSVLIE